MFSNYFLALDGFTQGVGVMSHILFSVYIDDLLLILSRSGVGCFIGFNFVGVIAYVDDIVLLAPTATALGRMLAI